MMQERNAVASVVNQSPGVAACAESGKEEKWSALVVRKSGDMHIPIEYIVLAAVASFLFIVLLCLLCYLCCHGPRDVNKTAEEGDGIVAVGYVPSHEASNSVYLVADKKEREASPTELVDAGFTQTQLVDQDVVREATKTELVAAGFTKSQLQEANVMPKPKKSKKVGSQKPLKAFDSSAGEEDDVRKKTKGKKRLADEDEGPRSVRKKRSSDTEQVKEFFAEPRRTRSGPVVRRKSSSGENVAGKRTRVRDSKEQVMERAAKSPASKEVNMTTLFG